MNSSNNNSTGSQYGSINMGTLRRSSRFKRKEREDNKEEEKEKPEKKLKTEEKKELDLLEVIPPDLMKYKIQPYLEACPIATNQAKKCLYQKSFRRTNNNEPDLDCEEYCEQNFDKWVASLLMEYDEKTHSLKPRVPRLLVKGIEEMGEEKKEVERILIPDKILLTLGCSLRPRRSFWRSRSPIPEVSNKFDFIWDKKKHSNTWRVNKMDSYGRKDLKTIQGKEDLSPKHIKEFISTLEFAKKTKDTRLRELLIVKFNFIFLFTNRQDIQFLKSLNQDPKQITVTQIDTKGRKILPWNWETHTMSGLSWIIYHNARAEISQSYSFNNAFKWGKGEEEQDEENSDEDED